MTTKTLPALIVEMAELTAQLIENRGELTPVLEEAMGVTSQELATKCDRYAFFLDRLDNEAELWAEKAAEYSRVSKSCKALKERLHGNIKAAMTALGQSDLEGNEIRFKLSKLPPKLVLEEGSLPSAYKMAVTEYVPDKERIKHDLGVGITIDGAKMEPVFSLRKYPNTRKA